MKRWLLLLALGIACSGEDTPEPWTSPVAFDTAAVGIVTDTDTITLTVEVASNAQQRAFGLMTRPSLDSLSGMLFTYDTPQDTTAGFWMFRTLLPLDIAFIDTTGTIVTTRSMDPCRSPNPEWCPMYASEKPYASALEVNRGFFAAHGVRPGHRVIVR